MAAQRVRADMPRLETARLVLRAPVVADCTVWERVWASSDATMTPERAWEEFCVYTAGWLLHGHGLFTVEHRQTGAVLGFVLLGLEWEDAEVELGWGFLPEARAKGYATEAASAARDHGLALLGAGHLVSYIDPLNTASTAVAQRLGATRDAAASHAIGDDVWRHGDLTQ